MARATLVLFELALAGQNALASSAHPHGHETQSVFALSFKDARPRESDDLGEKFRAQLQLSLGSSTVQVGHSALRPTSSRVRLTLATLMPQQSGHFQHGS